MWSLVVSKHSVGNSYECTPLSCVCWTERRERWESTVEKDHAEGRANDMDVGGPPCQYGLWWWQETWERTSRPFKFWRESDAGYLLWARELSSNLSRTALPRSHSEDRACTHIYENCLVCFEKSATPWYFCSKPLAQTFLLLGSGSHRVSFNNKRVSSYSCLHNAVFLVSWVFVLSLFVHDFE